jgi:hypothetical protein
MKRPGRSRPVLLESCCRTIAALIANRPANVTWLFEEECFLPGLRVLFTRFGAYDVTVPRENAAGIVREALRLVIISVAGGWLMGPVLVAVVVVVVVMMITMVVKMIMTIMMTVTIMMILILPTTVSSAALVESTLLTSDLLGVITPAVETHFRDPFVAITFSQLWEVGASRDPATCAVALHHEANPSKENLCHHHDHHHHHHNQPPCPLSYRTQTVLDKHLASFRTLHSEGYMVTVVELLLRSMRVHAKLRLVQWKNLVSLRLLLALHPRNVATEFLRNEGIGALHAMMQECSADAAVMEQTLLLCQAYASDLRFKSNATQDDSPIPDALLKGISLHPGNKDVQSLGKETLIKLELA